MACKVQQNPSARPWNNPWKPQKILHPMIHWVWHPSKHVAYKTELSLSSFGNITD